MSYYYNGDYVIVSHPNDASESNGFGDPNETFVITSIGENLFGQKLIKVRSTDDSVGYTSFYPHELSWEDGSRPTV